MYLDFSKPASPASTSIDAYISLLNYYKIHIITVHGSERVDIWICNLKIQRDKSWHKFNTSIFYQTAIRIGYKYPEQPLPNGCAQYPYPGAASPAGEKTTYDQVDSQRNNLQTWWKIWFVKYKFILNMPYCPYKSTNSHSYVLSQTW
jgi:hypothetical protein